MNRKQRIVIWIGAGLMVMLGLFPPGAGGFIFTNYDNWEVEEIATLAALWVMMAFVTGVVQGALRNNTNNVQK